MAIPTQEESKIYAGDMYNELKKFTNGNFRVMFEIIAMVFAVAVTNLRLYNPHISIEEIRKAVSDKVVELTIFMEKELPNLFGRH